MKKPLLVSACLVGEMVRYDGNALPDQTVMRLAQRGYTIIPFCPEVAGGLPVPRARAEICYAESAARLCVKNCHGDDVTAQFQQGAEEALALAKAQGAVVAILKEGSPSCGSQQIYDGTFSARRIAGRGITAALLQSNGIRVISELRVDEL